jgi:hypothetical protein
MSNYLFLLTILLAGCVALATNYETLYGPSAPKDRLISSDTAAAGDYVSFDKQVQPILNQRCIVCHSCYDAPCGLDLTSYEGLNRGANAMPVYNGARFMTSNPVRLGVDAQNTPAWREMGFYPVLTRNGMPLSPMARNCSMHFLRPPFPG